MKYRTTLGPQGMPTQLQTDEELYLKEITRTPPAESTRKNIKRAANKDRVFTVLNTEITSRLQ